jgi:hypothetical protein
MIVELKNSGVILELCLQWEDFSSTLVSNPPINFRSLKILSSLCYLISTCLLRLDTESEITVDSNLIQIQIR